MSTMRGPKKKILKKKKIKASLGCPGCSRSFFFFNFFSPLFSIYLFFTALSFFQVLLPSSERCPTSSNPFFLSCQSPPLRASLPSLFKDLLINYQSSPVFSLFSPFFFLTFGSLLSSFPLTFCPKKKAPFSSYLWPFIATSNVRN